MVVLQTSNFFLLFVGGMVVELFFFILYCTLKRHAFVMVLIRTCVNLKLAHANRTKVKFSIHLFRVENLLKKDYF